MIRTFDLVTHFMYTQDTQSSNHFRVEVSPADIPNATSSDSHDTFPSRHLRYE